MGSYLLVDVSVDCLVSPAGYSSTVYSYKRPGEIDKPPAQTLWITAWILVNLRTRIGKSAQPDQDIKKAPTRGAHSLMSTNPAADVAAFSQLREMP